MPLSLSSAPLLSYFYSTTTHMARAKGTHRALEADRSALATLSPRCTGMDLGQLGFLLYRGGTVKSLRYPYGILAQICNVLYSGPACNKGITPQCLLQRAHSTSVAKGSFSMMQGRKIIALLLAAAFRPAPSAMILASQVSVWDRLALPRPA